MTFFTAIVLISICFQTRHVKANIQEFRQCISVMINYCGSTLLDTLGCAERTVIHFTIENIQEDYIRMYHETFKNNLLPGPNMQLPLDFCSHRATNCQNDLTRFTEAITASSRVSVSSQKKEILNYAFLYTYFGDNYEPGNFAIDYLDHLSENMTVRGHVDDPEKFCKNMFIRGDKENRARNINIQN